MVQTLPPRRVGRVYFGQIVNSRKRHLSQHMVFHSGVLLRSVFRP